jgi:hypothetical protein
MASTVVRRDKLRRWSLVATVAAVLVALPAVVAALPASVDPVEPAGLRELIMRSTPPHHGYAESSGTLGVPDLPNLSQVTALLSTTTRIRTWYDSPDRWRFDVLSIGSERDVYRTPHGEFVWDYGANLLTQLIGEQPVRLPRAGDLLPPDLARRVLTSGDPVTAIDSRRVAGVDAAGIRVRPADGDTSVGQVDIWADPVSGLPVRVEVTARGASKPVLVTRFVDLSQERPQESILMPTIPPDAGFSMATAPDIIEALGVTAPVRFPDSLAGKPLQTNQFAGLPIGRYGTGLSSFVVLPLPRNLANSATDAARKAGASELKLNGGSGMLLNVPPLTAVVERSNVARRSYLIAGLVEPSVLERVADELSTVSRDGR